MSLAVSAAIEGLHRYCRAYFSTQWNWRPEEVLKDFWRISDDRLFYGVIGFLPNFLSFNAAESARAPLGFLLAIPIFELENAYTTDGWTAFFNVHSSLSDVVRAYRKIGMDAEADALVQVLALLDRGVSSEEEVVRCYKAAGSVFSDDLKREKFLKAYFCANRDLFAGAGPN